MQQKHMPPDEWSKDDTGIRTSKCACKPAAPRRVVAVGWLYVVINYLTDPDLGEDWQDLLTAWQALEAVVYQAKNTGDIFNRSSHMVERITTPMDYSSALNKALCKDGPNGIITMLIGLMWWGQGSLSMKEAALWRAMLFFPLEQEKDLKEDGLLSNHFDVRVHTDRSTWSACRWWLAEGPMFMSKGLGMAESHGKFKLKGQRHVATKMCMQNLTSSTSNFETFNIHCSWAGFKWADVTLQISGI
ncbi:hypothetical protein IW262DRAFT_1297712 [Armillaria fumosa]|nr:hypothetical protein IW262DRAFT_1297712 [Armillaria fumosa]